MSQIVVVMKLSKLTKWPWHDMCRSKIHRHLVVIAMRRNYFETFDIHPTLTPAVFKILMLLFKELLNLSVLF